VHRTQWGWTGHSYLSGTQEFEMSNGVVGFASEYQLAGRVGTFPQQEVALRLNHSHRFRPGDGTVEPWLVADRFGHVDCALGDISCTSTTAVLEVTVSDSKRNVTSRTYERGDLSKLDEGPPNSRWLQCTSAKKQLFSWCENQRLREVHRTRARELLWLGRMKVLTLSFFCNQAQNY